MSSQTPLEPASHDSLAPLTAPRERGGSGRSGGASAVLPEGVSVVMVAHARAVAFLSENAEQGTGRGRSTTEGRPRSPKP
eukprot:754387-Prorocentrum_minimum.AAC.1